MIMRDWLRVAFQPSVLRRGVLYATRLASELTPADTGTVLTRRFGRGIRRQRLGLLARREP